MIILFSFCYMVGCTSTDTSGGLYAQLVLSSTSLCERKDIQPGWRYIHTYDKSFVKKLKDRF